jgi:outer membrane protein assembly factor BamD
MVQFPNSKFVPKAQQMLRETQEVLAQKEFLTGDFYHKRGSFPAAANRLLFVSQQYPLFSGSDEALWELADSYKHMGDRFENQRAAALTKLVRDYPLSSHVNDSKEMLTAMKRMVPEADPAAYARMKYELSNRSRVGMIHRVIGPFESHPDTYMAAKSGAPAMESIRPSVPVSVPQIAAGGQAGISDVAVGVVGNTDAIDKQPDARLNIQPGAAGNAAPAASPATTSAPATGLLGTDEQKASVGANGQASTPSTPAAALAAQTAASTTSAASSTPAPEVLPTNHPATKDQLKAYKKQQEKAAKLAKKNAAAAKPAANATTPAVTTPSATPSQPAAPQ